MSKTALLLLAFGIAGLVIIPSIKRTDDHGGNFAALAYVNTVSRTAIILAMDNPNQPFQITKIAELDRTNFLHLSRYYWTPSTHFLVSTLPLSGNETSKPRRIIAVCDQPFTNVPQQSWGTSPPTHAVGYSDGTTGLISPAEFAALDRSTFVRLDELYPSQVSPPSESNPTDAAAKTP